MEDAVYEGKGGEGERFRTSEDTLAFILQGLVYTYKSHSEIKRVRSPAYKLGIYNCTIIQCV